VSQAGLRGLWRVSRPVVVGAALAAAVALVVGLVLTVAATPVYRAEVAVSIRPRVADLGAAEAAARLVRNYAAWVDSEAYAQRLTPDERAGLSPVDVVRNVRTSGDSDRFMVVIQSEDSVPARAAGTVNGLAAALIRELATPSRLDDPVRGLEIGLVDPARPPAASVWPRAEVILPVAAVLGALVGGALAGLAGQALGGAAAQRGASHG